MRSSVSLDIKSQRKLGSVCYCVLERLHTANGLYGISSRSERGEDSMSGDCTSDSGDVWRGGRSIFVPNSLPVNELLWN